MEVGLFSITILIIFLLIYYCHAALTGRRLEIRTAGGKKIEIPTGVVVTNPYFTSPQLGTNGKTNTTINTVNLPGTDLSYRIVNASSFPQIETACRSVAFDDIQQRRAENNQYTLGVAGGNGTPMVCKLGPGKLATAGLTKSLTNSNANIYYFN